MKMVNISDEVSRTFAEYRFIPRLTEEGLAKDSIDLSTPLTKVAKGEAKIMLKVPVLSAAMQSVTGPEMAIALAQNGGLGVLYCSQPIEDEARMVKAVKRARAGFVSRLDVIKPEATIEQAMGLIERTGYNTIPVVEGDKENYGKFLGVIEGPIPDNVPKDAPVRSIMRPYTKHSLEALVEDMNGKLPSKQIIELIRGYLYHAETGVTLKDANTMMTQRRIKYLPIVNSDGTLKFMIFRKDLKAHTDFPSAAVDENKRYLVGAAINTHDYAERAGALVDAGADVLFIDSSDGFSSYQRKCIESIKAEHDVPVVAGNIISAEAFNYLVGSGIDGIKVGMGGGSICITQEQKGTGRGQATAVLEVAKQRDAYFQMTGEYIPLISDGGIVHAKDLSMALAFGADLVMMGRNFAGCHESPTEIVERDGRKYKEYWGEGSLRAKAWVQKRYGQTDFDEGIVSLVPYTGRVSDNLEQTFAKVKATMISVGARNIHEFQEKALVEIISDASRKEGGVHDVEEIGSRSR